MKLAILILSLSICHITYGNRLFFANYTSAPELKSSTVNDIMQDENGLLWIATNKGLIQYDGRTFNRFPKKINADIANSSINKLALTNQFLWIGTFNNGLFRYNITTQQIKKISSIENDQIKAIEYTSQGKLYIGTDKGLIILNESFTDNPTPQVLLRSFVNCVFSDRDNHLWIGTWNNGLLHTLDKSPSNKVHFNHLFAIDTTITIMQINQDIHGRIWIGTWGHGIYLYDIEKDSLSHIDYKQFQSGPEGKIITDIVFDNDNNAWLSTYENGVFSLDEELKIAKNYTTETSQHGNISSNTIYKLYLTDNILWVGTVGDGINSTDLTYSHFEQIGKEILGTNHISCVKQDYDSTLWIGTLDKGMYHYNVSTGILKSIDKVTSGSSITTNHISSLCVDKEYVWIGSNYGLYKYSKHTNKISYVFNANRQKEDVNIQSMMMDREGNLLLGFLNGTVTLYYPNRDTSIVFTQGSSNNKLQINIVQTLLEDRNGNYWVGLQKGLLRINKKTQKVEKYLKGESSLTSHNISALHEDRNGNLWIGTFDNGIIVLNRKQEFEAQFTTENNLPNNEIQAFVEEENGTIWVLSPNGAATVDIESLTIEHKNIANSANNFYFNGGIVLSNGKLLFTGNGITIFESKYGQIAHKTWSPILTQLNIFNTPAFAKDTLNSGFVLDSAITYNNSIDLCYSENVFSLEFTCPSVRNYYQANYAFMLEGFDKGWNFTNSTTPKAHYMNLKGGIYYFNVKTLHPNGKWSRIKQLTITIHPPFWKTIWFISLILLVTLIAMYIFIKYQIKQKQKEYEREQLKKEQEIIKLKNEKLSVELETQTKQLEHKNSEITSAVVNITRKNEVLNNIKSNLNDLVDKVGANVRPRFKAIIKEIDNDVAVEKNWEQFITHFNALHKNFLDRLKNEYPDLSPSNLRLCAYLRLNLTSKEIATMMNISVSGVEKSRYRLRKKLGLATEENLTEFIMKYE